MSDEEKTLRMIMARPALTELLEKVLKRLGEISKAVQVPKPEFILIFVIDFLRATLHASKNAGIMVDLDGLLSLLKQEIYGEES